MASSKDYYQILGVSETATTDEIKKVFRRLAKQHHPDRNPNNPQAAERFKEINEAHDVLSDADKRRKYDQLRRYGAYAGAARPSEGAGGGHRFRSLRSQLVRRAGGHLLVDLRPSGQWRRGGGPATRGRRGGRDHGLDPVPRRGAGGQGAGDAPDAGSVPHLRGGRRRAGGNGLDPSRVPGPGDDLVR